MTYFLKILGRLPCLNDYIEANRIHRQTGAKLKKETEELISWYIIQQLKGVKITEPVMMKYIWIEPNRKRDLDGISSFGRKCIQDALVKCGVLQNDGWKQITGFIDRFEVDKENPRIEVILKEVEHE